MSTVSSDKLWCLEDGRTISKSKLRWIRGIMGVWLLMTVGGVFAENTDMGSFVAFAVVAVMLTLVYWGLLRLGSRKH